MPSESAWQPSRPDPWWKYVATLLLVVFGHLVIGSLPLFWALTDPALKSESLPTDTSKLSDLGLDPTYGFALIMFPFLSTLICLGVGLKLWHGRNLSDLIGKFHQKQTPKTMLVAALVYLGILCISFVYGYLTTTDNYLYVLDLPQFVPFALLALILVPLQTSAEELVFRGYLLQAISTRLTRPIWPILITSVLFAAVHSGNLEASFGLTYFLYLFVISLILGVITTLSQSLWAAIVLHTINNLFALLIVSYTNSSIESFSVWQIRRADITGLGVTSVIYLLGLGVYFCLHKQNFHRVFSAQSGYIRPKA